ncbi:orotidine-5'-phosphate decarboxylase [Aminithiophilus ramosus]|uniref:Orotidine 5'-phosphate decarboxylase n=1 Tax=Aminithiophilus ramosus TaxID=3029084 RepID=A0A9Q7A984_9BACT|nr:orotidine-5'-phosphate decarboxylase [Aminithiophilus ramosus]QTX32910.1 orotidine-5'-phosphate decarboxylase [Aminithiophilus ramosus]
MKDSKLIVALDLPTIPEALSFLDETGDLLPLVKVGPGLFFQGGEAFLELLVRRGHKVFLDVKLHDIPNTVALAVRALSCMGLWALTVHTSGGVPMMRAAVQEAGTTLILGVTVLTSLDEGQWSEVHPSSPMRSALIARASAAQRARLGGLVCSPQDLKTVRAASSLKTIVPGIRPALLGDDQARTATPREAIAAGADYLVVGRPILAAKDRRQAVETILEEIEEGLSCLS